LALARRQNGQWSKEALIEGVWESERMRVTGSGAVHIARYNYEHQPEYITNKLGEWSRETVFADSVDRVELALTPTGQPVLLVSTLGDAAPLLAELLDDSWIFVSVPIQGVTFGVFLEIDAKGHLYFLTGLEDAPSLLVATNRTGEWEANLVYEGNDAYFRPSLSGADMTIAADDSLHAAFQVEGYEVGYKALYYLPDLLGEHVANVFDVVAHNAQVRVNQDSTVFLLFDENDAQTSWITSAIREKGTWKTEKLIEQLIEDFDLVVDAEGRPHVSVVQDGNVWYFTRP
jgi:hypothetical protein